MSVSAILELLQVTETQSEKMTAFNTVMEQMEKIMADTYTVSTITGETNYTLPYDNTSDLSDRRALRFIRLMLVGSADATFNVLHPRNKHMFFVRNDTTQIARFDAGGATVDVQPGSGQVLYCDGNDFFLLLNDTARSAADFSIQYWGKPAASEILADMLVARQTFLLDDFAGARGIAGVAPAVSPYVIDVLVNASVVGTVSITGSTFTFATTGGAVTVDPGERLILRAPATEDANFSDIRIVLPATVFL